MLSAQQGGKLLGQGVYGCAFTPPLKCRGKPQRPTNIVTRHVGKLTSDFDAYWESTVSDLLNKNPLAPNYFVLIESACIPDVRSEQTEADLSQCEIIKGKRLPAFKQISMSFGGTPLTMASLRPDRFDFVAFTKHLLEAGALLLVAGVAHGDLHSGNVLVDEYQVPRFIDFGLAIVPSTLTVELLKFYAHQPDFQFNQESPELSLFWARYAGLEEEDLISKLVEQKPVFRDIASLLGASKERAKTELEIFEQSSQALLNKNGVKLYQTYWPQIDAWSIGVILVNILKRLSAFKEFQENQSYARNKMVLDKMMRRLTEPNPMKRPDAIEALSEFIDDASLSSFVLTEPAVASWLSARRQQQL